MATEDAATSKSATLAAEGGESQQPDFDTTYIHER